MIHLTTSRLILKQLLPDEGSAIIDYYLRNLAYLKPFEPIRADEFYTESYWRIVLQAEQTTDFENTQLRLAIMERSHPKRVIGITNFSGFIRGVFQACYLGYSLDEHKQGQGYMTEALTEAIRFLFEERNMHRIMANCLVSNQKSLAVLERLGFAEEGRAKEYLFINGKWEDHIMTALINENWVNK